MVDTPRPSRWYLGFWSVWLIMIAVLIYVGLAIVDEPLGAAILLVITGPATLLRLYCGLNTAYIFGDTTLRVRYGPFSAEVAYRNISSVEVQARLMPWGGWGANRYQHVLKISVAGGRRSRIFMTPSDMQACRLAIQEGRQQQRQGADRRRR